MYLQFQNAVGHFWRTIISTGELPESNSGSKIWLGLRYRFWKNMGSDVDKKHPFSS